MKAMRTLLYAVVATAPLAGLGCDDKTPLVDDSRLVPSARKPVTTSEAITRMPVLRVDERGAHIGMEVVNDLKTDISRSKLTRLVGKLPINDKAVTMEVSSKSAVPDVVVMVNALGRAGAPQVTLKRVKGRPDLPSEITVTPEPLIKKAPDGCSVAATVTEKLDTGVWPYKGGGGARHRKGQAGPDMSTTFETLTDRLKKCSSKVAFFRAHDSLTWELAYNMGASIVKADEAGRIDTLVLLTDDPAAGRAIKLTDVQK